MVKAGLIVKGRGFWKLTNNDGIDLDRLTPQSLMTICDQKYKAWRRKRSGSRRDQHSSHLIEDPYDAPLNNLKLDPRKVSFDDLLKGVDKYVGTPFQREFVWSPTEICFLLDSIYRGYPIGSFTVWKTLRRLHHHREIGGIKLNDVAKGSLIDYVLDGQQRITSLYAAIRGAQIEGEKYVFYFNLTSGTSTRRNLKKETILSQP